MSEAGSDDNAIDLVVPLQAAYASTVRIVVAAVAADLEFSVDELDDLRLGVSEVFNLFADGVGPGARCCTHIATSDDGVTIAMSRTGSDEVIELDGLASTILSSVVDEFSVVDGAVTLVKRAREALAS
jgi:serine/threonine-protein kinase RsbW